MRHENILNIVETTFAKIHIFCQISQFQPNLKIANQNCIQQILYFLLLQQIDIVLETVIWQITLDFVVFALKVWKLFMFYRAQVWPLSTTLSNTHLLITIWRL